MLDNVKGMLSRDWNIRVFNVYMETNKIADALANLNFNHDIETFLYDNCPIAVTQPICPTC